MSIGLDNVVAAETKLSHVDGERGRLIIGGKLLDDLAFSQDYETVLSLLFQGQFNREFTPAEVNTLLSEARQDVFLELSQFDQYLINLTSIDALRSLISRFSDENNEATAFKLIAALGVFTSALIRKRQGKALIKPQPGLNHATDILQMAGLDYSDIHRRALNTYLVTIIDHGLNASTFASRVIASTKSGLVSSVIAAISALKGPLHGGAPGPVLDMLDDIDNPENAKVWLQNALSRNERLMGFGHRVYKVRDPRADALKRAISTLQDSASISGHRLALAAIVEELALQALKEKKPDHPLHTNVEFYTALLLEALGFDREDFTSIFAVGRVGGWIAHAREQIINGRLIRPKSHYIGVLPD
ncbi:citrate synthase/methylcitrate synthase [Acinetobacter oleivorans]|uniref:citrate synthase/methylcitrate synthase n=1 Tax=Acinetobacter oleivorans TaxID=1148157 RepID=UPI001CD1A8D1|nr:citrate synthase/methylcitrate synthase [Acinetobacter oleivorans]